MNSAGFAFLGAAAFLVFATVAVLRAGEVDRLRVVLVDFFTDEFSETGAPVLLGFTGAEAAPEGSVGVVSLDVFELFAICFCFWWVMPLPEERASASGNRHETGFQKRRRTR